MVLPRFAVSGLSRLASFWLVGVLRIAWGLQATPVAHAAAIVVATCNAADLVNAINAANSDPSPDTIELDPACTGAAAYTLTAVNNGNGTLDPNGLPIITSPIRLNGNGAAIVRGSAPNTPLFRIFEVDQPGDLTLIAVTISGGRLPDGFPGNLANNPSPGGGIIVRQGQLTLTDVTLSGNATGNGVVGAGGGGEGGPGGGLFNFQGQVTVRNSTLSGNVTGNGIGGGGVMTVTNSTIAGNTTGKGGTGVLTGGGVANGGFGGGVAQFEGASLTLLNSTLSGNTTGPNGSGTGKGPGGGIASKDGAYTAQNALVAGNQGDPTLGNNCAGPAAGGSSTNNLADDTSCGSIFSQKTAVELRLQPLAANGGSTPTVALGAGSAAIDQGAANLCPDRDQRYATRSKPCDVGAFELGGALPALPTLSKTFNPPSIVSGGTSTLTLTLSNLAGNGLALTNISFQDTLPSRLRFTGAPTHNCPGGTATVNGSMLVVSGVNLPAGQTCALSVPVSSATVGSWPNMIDQIRANETGVGTISVTATLTVNPSPTPPPPARNALPLVTSGGGPASPPTLLRPAGG